MKISELIKKFPEEEDNEKEWLYCAAKDLSFDFLKKPEEDIYSLKDGNPFHDKR